MSAMTAGAAPFAAPRPLPPIPRGEFCLGHIRPFKRDPLGFITRFAREHGDIAGMEFAGARVYQITGPAYIEQVLATRHRDFGKGNSFRQPLMKGLFGNGLVSSEGEFWLRQRHLAQPAFHRERVHAYGEVMVEFTRRQAERWEMGATRDLQQEMMDLTRRIVVKTLFDADVEADARAIGATLDRLMAHFVGTWGLMGILDYYFPILRRRFTGTLDRLNKCVYAIIRERRENPRDTGDLLSMLLAARDDEGGGMTDQQLRDETMTFFFAGHETTALALTWALHLLMEHPECERRLLEEADSQLGDREATAEDVSRLPYASQVLKETMRLFPPVWGLSREALVDCEVGGHEIPKGTQLMLSQWVTHRDPRFWDEPEAFRPDRWQDDLEKRLPRIVYFPFGSGPRMCIGYTFALMEAVLILTSLIRHHRFAPAPGQRVEPWATMTIRPKEGLRAVITRRTR